MLNKHIEIDYTKVRKDSYGYLIYKGYKVHRLIWENNYGEIPNGYHIHHLDGDKTNNNIKNLQILSFEEHMLIHSNNIIINGEKYRKCSGCKAILLSCDDNFYKNVNRKKNLCKNCSKNYQKQIRKDKNINKIKEKLFYISGIDHSNHNVTEKELELAKTNTYLFNNKFIKICSKCKEAKLLSEMVKNSEISSGVSSVCKKCMCNYNYKKEKIPK